MKSAKHFYSAALAAVLSVSLLMPALAQVGGGGGGFGGGAGLGGYQIDPAQVRDAILNPIRDEIVFTDDEWAVISPKIWKVITLEIDSGPNGLANLTGTRLGGGRGGRRITTMITQLLNNGKPSETTAKADALQTAIDDPETSNVLLATRLHDYREAVRKVREQLAAAQDDLKSVLTVREEAALLSAGILE